MKQLLLLLLLASPALALAQRSGSGTTTTVVQSFTQSSYSCQETISRQQQRADSLLQSLDKSQIPTHILYDRVGGRAALDVFNRVYNDPDTSDVHHYLQAYYEMHVAFL